MLKLQLMDLKGRRNYEHFIQPSGHQTSVDIFSVDSNEAISSASLYYTLDTNVQETGGGLILKNIEIFDKSIISTTSKGNLQGMSVIFNSDQHREKVSFSRVGNDYFLKIRSLSSESPIYLPQAILEPNSLGLLADLDLFVQTSVRKIWGENLHLISRDKSIVKTWRQFRTLLKSKNK